MKIEITKSNLESIISSSNENFNLEIDNKVNALFSSVISKISEKNQYVTLNNTMLIPVNETFNRGFSSSSSYEYILAISNLQLELNSLRKSNIFSNSLQRFIEAYKVSRQNKKSIFFRKKRKNQQKTQKKLEFNEKNYDFMDLRTDIFNVLPEFLSTTSVVSLNKNTIKIVGENDFGKRVTIYVNLMLFSGENFKYYDAKTSKFFEFSLSERVSHFSEKYDRVGDVLISLIKIFNCLYFAI